MNRINQYLERPWICMLTIGLAAFLAYANAINGDFLGDDYERIKFETETYQQGPAEAMAKIMPDRPLLIFSLWVNHAISGLNTWSYKILNIIFHALAGIALYWFLFLLLEPHEQRNRLSFFTALLFVVHPLNNQAVNVIVQRGSIIAAASILLAMIFCLWAIKKKDSQYYIFALVVLLGGITFKQNAMIFPLVLFWYGIVFKNAQAKKWPFMYAMVCLIPILIYMTLGVDDQARFKETLGSMDYFKMQWRVVLRYWSMVFFPFNLKYDYYLPTSLIKGATTYIYLVPHLFFFGLLGWFYKRKWKELLFFGGAIYITFAPESSFFPIRHSMFEHRAYLPLAMILAFCSLVFLNIKKVAKFYMPVMLILSLLALGCNVKRNQVSKKFSRWIEQSWDEMKYDSPWVGSYIFYLLTIKDLTKASVYLHEAQTLPSNQSPNSKRSLSILEDLVFYDQYKADKQKRVLEKMANFVRRPKIYGFKYNHRLYINSFIWEELKKIMPPEQTDLMVESLITPQLGAMEENVNEFRKLLKDYIRVLHRIKYNSLQKQKSGELTPAEEKQLNRVLDILATQFGRKFESI